MPRPVVALITAYNEEPTVGGVIDAVQAASLVTRVQVVDDASEDGTYEAASSKEGVRVVRLEKRVPVGEAFLSHLAHLEEPNAIVFFCDADLVGLTPHHVDSIVRPVLHGEAGMAVGLKDKRCGALVKFLTKDLFPKMDILIGGERAMYREIADSVLGAPHSSGYGLVTVMNRFCRRHRIPVKVVYMDGCNHRTKLKKWRFKNAAAGLWHLFFEITRAQIATAFCPWKIPAKKFEKIPELSR
jgi:glycosyltransferase involved in cell wall biosynthesis